MNYPGGGIGHNELSSGKLRAAMYARYSRKGQHETSIDDQIRECRETAEKNGWVMMDEYIRFDKARTGKTMARRNGLKELVDLAQQKPCPFDLIIFHSTSRAGRNLSDTLPLIDLLLFCGVQLFFVDTGLSSANPNFRDLYIMYGRNDEHYSRQVGLNVKRGQRGRVLNGFVGCSRAYGYRNVPVEDPVETMAYKRKKVLGVQYEINPEEAKIIVRCFELCASGMPAIQIAKTLNIEGVPSPLSGKKGKKRVWHPGTVIRLLSNMKYIGVHIYNKRKAVRHPSTGTVLMVARPECEWDTVQKPEWRIVSDELWQQAQAMLRHKKFNGRKRGGLNRSDASRKYIFSGIMKCRSCGGKINIVQSKRHDPLYGCHRCRFNGTCDNELQVSQLTLEAQLISAMVANLEDPALRNLLVLEFRRQLQEAIDAHEARLRDRDGLDALKARQQVLLQERDNLLNAIASGAKYAFIQERLDATVTELNSIKATLEQPQAPPPKLISERQVDQFLAHKMGDIASVLRSEPEVAKLEVQNRVEELWLEPIETDDGPAYRVTGDLRLFAVLEDRKVDTSLKTLVHLSPCFTVPFSVVVPGRIPAPEPAAPEELPTAA